MAAKQQLSSERVWEVALTDLLAVASGWMSELIAAVLSLERSEYLDGTKITLTWLDGHTSSATIGQKVTNRHSIRYLSQSFVEKLCQMTMRAPS